jgi:hypothetical protein
MAVKSFTTYHPDEEEFIEMDDHAGETQRFKLNPSIPGTLILDFMFVSGTEDSSKLAEAIHSVLDAAVVEEEQERWKEFVNDPKNGVTISVLSEIVGHVTAVLSGNDQDQE